MTTADRSVRTTALARATTRRLTATVATLAPFIIEMNLSPYLTAGMLGALTALTFLPEGTRHAAGGQQNGAARPAPAGENDSANAAAVEAQAAAGWESGGAGRVAPGPGACFGASELAPAACSGDQRRHRQTGG